VSLLADGSPSRPATDPTPTGPILRNAGEILWYNSDDDDLLAVNPVTGEERVLAEDIGYLDHAEWSADGRWAAFEATTGLAVVVDSLWVVGPELEPRKIMDLPDPDPKEASWALSPTGAQLAVDTDSTLQIIDLPTGVVTELGSTAGSISSSAWSPDGTRIVFAGQPRWIHTVDVRTGEVSPVVELSGDVEGIDAFSWSPDGSRLAVRAVQEDGARLLVMGADGSSIRIVAKGELTTADWSPDGSQIVFAEEIWPPQDDDDPTGSYNIWTAPADGSTASLVYASSPGDRWWLWSGPVWSPDGSQIAFSEEPNRAFVVDAAGSSDAEPIDDLTYASWSGGSFCWECLSWINDAVRYTGPSDT
jgi:Tol biopolymer transport system component